MADSDNPNWGECPKCGSPVMIDPASGRLQACARCASAASPYSGVLGVFFLLLGLAAVVALVYFCIELIL
ncbi:MAG: hypothetical protein RIC55_03185 [Pirellulaceae bacterium]